MSRRQVGTAAPVLAALAGGGDREATVSALYGGSGGADSAASAVYAAIGNVRSHTDLRRGDLRTWVLGGSWYPSRMRVMELRALVNTGGQRGAGPTALRWLAGY